MLTDSVRQADLQPEFVLYYLPVHTNLCTLGFAQAYPRLGM